MAQIYVSDETKRFIDEASKFDSRTQDGEIKYLCKERLGETRVTEIKLDIEQNAAG